MNEASDLLDNTPRHTVIVDGENHAFSEWELIQIGKLFAGGDQIGAQQLIDIVMAGAVFKRNIAAILKSTDDEFLKGDKT